ncbi:hypothetical protein L1987_77172 [Smallanthus sonchifolius]|uniref:Uncharacterized protein n=1 Tax=Smallanthus sonchifolius TaxID=185202 RepID=A0ACB8ZDM1_9ASTR|nr:hypothetical protein L1987_77172 [Smallanthus sonchifolius]
MTNGPSVISESLAQYGDMVYVDRKQCSSQAVSGSYADCAMHFMELPIDIPYRQPRYVENAPRVEECVAALASCSDPFLRDKRKLDQLDEEDRAIGYFCDFEQRFKFHEGFDEIDYIDDVRVSSVGSVLYIDDVRLIRMLNKVFMKYVDELLRAQWIRTQGVLSRHWKENEGKTDPQWAINFY